MHCGSSFVHFDRVPLTPPPPPSLTAHVKLECSAIKQLTYHYNSDLATRVLSRTFSLEGGGSRKDTIIIHNGTCIEVALVVSFTLIATVFSTIVLIIF